MNVQVQIQALIIEIMNSLPFLGTYILMAISTFCLVPVPMLFGKMAVE